MLCESTGKGSPLETYALRKIDRTILKKIIVYEGI